MLDNASATSIMKQNDPDLLYFAMGIKARDGKYTENA